MKERKREIHRQINMILERVESIVDSCPRRGKDEGRRGTREKIVGSISVLIKTWIHSAIKRLFIN